MDNVTQTQQTVQCGLLTDSGQSVEGSNGHSDTEPSDGTVGVLTDSGQTVEDSSRHSDTEPTDGIV